jgi:hypothetical protein
MSAFNEAARSFGGWCYRIAIHRASLRSRASMRAAAHTNQASQPFSLNPTGTQSRRHLAHFVSAIASRARANLCCCPSSCNHLPRQCSMIGGPALTDISGTSALNADRNAVPGWGNTLIIQAQNQTWYWVPGCMLKVIGTSGMGPKTAEA